MTTKIMPIEEALTTIAEALQVLAASVAPAEEQRPAEEAEAPRSRRRTPAEDAPPPRSRARGGERKGKDEPATRSRSRGVARKEEAPPEKSTYDSRAPNFERLQEVIASLPADAVDRLFDAWKIDRLSDLEEHEYAAMIEDALASK